MLLTNRFAQTLEVELRRQLAFTYIIERERDEHGVPVTFVKVSLRNNSLATLKDLRGSISPASGALFRRTWFRIRRLESRGQSEIARIPVRIPDAAAVDPLATVDYSSDLDLSLCMIENERALTRAAKPSVEKRVGASIPLSHASDA